MTARAQRGNLLSGLGEQRLTVAAFVQAMHGEMLGHTVVDQIHHRAGVEQARLRHLQLRRWLLKWVLACKWVLAFKRPLVQLRRGPGPLAPVPLARLTVDARG